MRIEEAKPKEKKILQLLCELSEKEKLHCLKKKKKTLKQ